jgi:hypothetical protein
MRAVHFLTICITILTMGQLSAATRYVDGSVASSGNGTSWATAFKTIQQGINAAVGGDTVIVAEGTYFENIEFKGKNIVLTSTDPLGPNIVANTIIDGNDAGSVVTFDGTETEACVLSGFTIRNGNAEWGGGISGGTDPTATYATIQNNTITANSAEQGGGGVYMFDGLIQNNTITGNSAPYGGGLNFCWGTIRNNVIAGNSAGLEGGGLDWCVGTIDNNTIVGNSAKYNGGGLAYCAGTSMQNCIVWGNTALNGPQFQSTGPATYCCIQDWTQHGEGNISINPRFHGGNAGSFRLSADSPCIDAGSNSPDLPEFDIVGMHRIMFGGKSRTVDMGAYEFYINKVEPVPGTNEAVFTWSSLAGNTYSIFYTDNLLNWHTAIANFPSTGNQTTSWTDDSSLTGIPPLLAPKRFYRVLENP